ncbi:MAG TPA: ligase-associated DNA damage response endonuclease PdeM [Longimicrobium sp.]|jgi:DNA ligase-associated metallophosphoesterase|uniref:ligase-associated DNA damage response endonuclease PdeM n=1 Tax=Longimicrobium sp. TaxID=2029185 RepID=UPI002ED8F9C9
MTGDLEIELCGEPLVLLPERAAYRPRDRTLLVADPHFGKAASFRAFGVPVPGGTTTETLARLTAALARTGAERLVFLGDFFHARAGKQASTLNALAAWREEHARLPILLVRGNHDRHAGDPPDELRINCANGPVVDDPFGYAHHPEPADACYVLAGHVHPSVTLRGIGRQKQRLACFHFGPRVGILPAFGEFTGTADVPVSPGDRVYVVAGDQVVSVL